MSYEKSFEDTRPKGHQHGVSFSGFPREHLAYVPRSFTPEPSFDYERFPFQVDFTPRLPRPSGYQPYPLDLSNPTQDTQKQSGKKRGGLNDLRNNDFDRFALAKLKVNIRFD
jgi:hypothetical protein